jgi:cell shape-determining protein MreC
VRSAWCVMRKKRNTQYAERNTNMAWKRIKVRIQGNSQWRCGSLSRRMLFIWCMLAGSILYLAPQNLSNKFQLAFAHVFSFPLSMGSNISLTARMQQRPNDTVPKKQYEELKNLYANLEQTLIQQRRELKRLSDLNDFVGQNMDYIIGYIIPAAADRLHSELTIDCSRGTLGLEKGQFVLARDNSIIGRITDIFPQLGKAKVRLITDPDSKIPVKIDELDQSLQMQGNGNDTARIGMVSREKDIKEGQRVFALRQPGFLDAPMITGTVSKCKRDDKSPLLWDITVKPAWKLEELDEVAIIIMKPPK